MTTALYPSRRKLLCFGAGVIAAMPFLAAQAGAVPRAAIRTLGLIVPPAGDILPPEPQQMYPEGFRFISKGLGLERLTVQGYSSVIDRVAELSSGLAAEGAEAIVLMGTSLSFFRGAAFDAELIATMQKASGRPAITMSRAVVEALREVGARRLAVGTAYVDEVNAKLVAYMTESGFEVQGLRSLQLGDVASVLKAQPQDVMNVGLEAAAASPSADALFISCGGLRTLNLLARLEKATKLPVVSSATAGAWGGVRLVGHSGNVEGYGCQLSEADRCGIDGA
ncbi:aspartate/glutamate racemase family protein [Sphingopyxis sp.]|uniref:arylmalonate decarboxylase n=1 Tax=Sphingopyxis sp. TaxID=1908224 RepID=UPI002FC8A645